VPLVFSILILWCVFQFLGMEGKVWFISAMFFTRLLLPVCLGDNRRNGGVKYGPFCNFR